MGKAKHIGQYWRTIKHLRPEQMRGQFLLRLRRLAESPGRLEKIAGVPLPAPGSLLPPDLSLVPPVRPPGEKAAILQGDFNFLNETNSIGWPPEWTPPGAHKLWQYHLHYHDWLWSLPFSQARDAALDWTRRHPLGKGQVGWEPYPTSLRLMNWTALFWGYWRGLTQADAPAATVLWASIRLQAEWLMRHIETHLMGNHLLENGCALAFVGAAFGGPVGERWKSRGLDILERQLPEQMLADGLHFERSPMYHQRVVQALLWLHATGDPALVQIAQRILPKAFTALRHLTHPDGGIALLNDAALQVYPSLKTLLRQAERQGVLLAAEPKPGLFVQPLAGYYGARTESEDYLVCDAAPIGPDYIPGHAHGDMLSFELSLSGKRMIVDSGVFDYEISAMRDYCRSTRAHNTVEIDGEDQCEFWAAFRVGHRGRPRELRYEAKPESGSFVLEAWHDGYRRLPGSPKHRRRFRWEPRCLVLEDTIESSQPVQALGRLHLHPDCEVHTLDGHVVGVERDGVLFHIHFSGPGEVRLEGGWYCPRFRERHANQTLVWAVEAASATWETRIVW